LWSSGNPNQPITVELIKSTVLKIRKERAGMVQTKDQYYFIFQSLREKIADYLRILDYKNSM
jgi:protein tyrosine phosphatase